MNKNFLYYIIMCVTWFVGYFACNIFLEICLDILNFLMQQDFYNTKNFSTFKFCPLFAFLYPVCIYCYLQFKYIRSLSAYIVLSIIVAIIFLVLYILWNKIGGFNPSHKAFITSLAFLMSILACVKLEFINKTKYLEFATLSASEFSSIFFWMMKIVS